MQKIIFTCLLFVVCSYQSNFKQEIYFWEENQKEYLETISKYPNFRAILEFKMKQAESLWLEASKLKDEMQKVNQMKQANLKIYQILNPFIQIKYKSEAIVKYITQLKSKEIVDNKLKEQAIVEGQTTLQIVEAKLSETIVTSEEDVQKITSELISLLSKTQDNLDKAVKAIKK
jgi:hypothetical protein